MSGEASAVAEAIDGLFDAMDRQDMDRLAALCAQDRRAVHIGTDRDERWFGWEELRSATRKQFDRLEAFRVDAKDRRIHLSATGSVAWFHQRLDAEIVSEDGSTRLEGARLTGVAEKQEGDWALVQTHLSVPRDPGTQQTP